LSVQAVSPLLAITQGDSAGVGPELLLDLLAAPPLDLRLLLIGEAAALDAAAPGLERSGRATSWRDGLIVGEGDFAAIRPGGPAVLERLGVERRVEPGESQKADAAGAVACLDTGIELARAGSVQALVTGPVSKESIARHVLPGFRGHTDYIAEACGLERYGSDYLMTFLAADLQVALLTTHLPLVEALRNLETEMILEALECLGRHAGGRIAVAGINPHAGEGGLLGREDGVIVAPAIEEGRRRGLDVHGPLSPDSLFARARSGEFDWVLALYHDQGLIPVKTLAFGSATNWTLGLPFLRTSVDHGTAFEIAGRGQADARPLRRVLETTASLFAGELPKKASRA